MIESVVADADAIGAPIQLLTDISSWPHYFNMLRQFSDEKRNLNAVIPPSPDSFPARVASLGYTLVPMKPTDIPRLRQRTAGVR